MKKRTGMDHFFIKEVKQIESLGDHFPLLIPSFLLKMTFNIDYQRTIKQKGNVSTELKNSFTQENLSRQGQGFKMSSFFIKPHSHPNGFFYVTNECSWSLTPANSMQVTIMQSDDCNRR